MGVVQMFSRYERRRKLGLGRLHLTTAIDDACLRVEVRRRYNYRLKESESKFLNVPFGEEENEESSKR